MQVFGGAQSGRNHIATMKNMKTKVKPEGSNHIEGRPSTIQLDEARLISWQTCFLACSERTIHPKDP